MEATVEKNPLIILYRDLDGPELRRLGKWLDSPVHNQRDDVRHLHAYLTGGGGRMQKSTALAKTRVWKQLFPGESYDDARLRQTFHWALRATEAFLAYEHWSRNPLNPQLALTRELRHRNLGRPLGRSLKRVGKLQAGAPVRNENYYRHQYHLEQERYYERSASNRLADTNLQEISDNLDLAYLIEKLRAGCNIIFHRRIYRSDFEPRMLDEAVRYAATLDPDDHPAAAIYYLVYRGLTDDDEDGQIMSRLRKRVLRHHDVLGEQDLYTVIVMSINLCISGMNRGRTAYVREAFEWYRLGFELRALTTNEQFNQQNYLNVISIALKLGEYAWTENFIADYSHRIDDGSRANTEAFALARLRYEQGRLDDSAELLIHVDFKHPVYNLLARTLQLKIYYQQGEYDALDSLLDSITTYLRRKTLSDVQRANFSNVVKYVRRMTRLAPGDTARRTELREQVAKETPLSEKEWMLTVL